MKQMNKIITVLAKTIIVVLLSIFLFLSVIYLIGIVINDTESIPKGIYLKTYKTLKRGDYIMFCGNNNADFQMANKRNYFGFKKGQCENNKTFLIKEIVGIPKDKININLNGITVNNQLIQNTKPLEKDYLDRKLQPHKLETFLNDDEYIVVGTSSEYSFDSRYFGVIKKKQIKAILTPIYLME